MSGRVSALLTALFLAACLLVFLNRAAVQGRQVNTDMEATDQSAYIRQGIELRTSDFTYVNPRNRMPLYPGLLALFMDREPLVELREAYPDSKDYFPRACAAFFETGKKINTVVAVALLAMLAAVFLARFPRHHALNLWVLAAFGVIVFKAQFVQAELLYYLLTFSAFLVCWRLFGRPSLWLAILGGALLGLGHLTKASVLPGVLVFAVFYPLDALWQRWRTQVAPLRRLLITALLVAGYFAVIAPYIIQSKKMFGSYFYNVNSTFYMWCDSWTEAKSRTGGAGDRKSFPDLPKDELPSLSNYLKTHTTSEVIMRPIKGFSVVFNSMKRAYGYLGPCLGYLAFAVFLIVMNWRLVWRLFARRPMPVLALAAYFGGYYLLIAWYSQIINGNRFILGLFLPFLFTVSVVIVKLAPRMRWSIAGHSVSALAAFNIAMSAWIAVQVAMICFSRISWVYGGG